MGLLESLERLADSAERVERRVLRKHRERVEKLLRNASPGSRQYTSLLEDIRATDARLRRLDDHPDQKS